MKIQRTAHDGDLIGARPRAGARRVSRRILVVDHDSDLCRLYAEALTRPGYRIDIAGDGATAWEALQASTYSLLITEHDVPNLSGVELVRKLRAAHMALPVVMAAGRLPTETLAQEASLQFAAMLVKPFAVEELRETVRVVLRDFRERIEPPPHWQSLASVGLRL